MAMNDSTVLSFTEKDVPLTQELMIADLLWVQAQTEQRCLFEAADWATECLVFMPDEAMERLEPPQPTPSSTSLKTDAVLRMVQAQLRAKNFHRALSFAERFPEPLSPLHFFLQHFCVYLISIKAEVENVNHAEQRVTELNAHRLLRRLRRFKETTPDVFDCWGHYLLGLVFVTVNDKMAARGALVDAINADSRCWPAWDLLATVVKNKDERCLLEIPEDAWMRKIFLARLYMKLNLLSDAIDLYDMIAAKSIGPVPFVIMDKAKALTGLQEHEASCALMAIIEKDDPYCIEGMDTYSESLFVRYEVEKLFVLMKRFERSHKYAWQTCVISANYYNTTKQHTKAREALLCAAHLNPKNPSIWVLLGHEMMELKNPTDAISAYRKAIEIDADCYRAYYGMGQLYEIFQFFEYSLQYYEEAHRCRPFDSRVLVALGVVFFHLKRYKDAENSFIKAFRVGDLQGNALTHVADLYNDQGDKVSAAKAYKSFLTVYGDQKHADSKLIARASLYLAKIAFEDGNHSEGEEHAARCFSDETTKDEALGLVKRYRMENKKHVGSPMSYMSVDEE